MNVNLTLFIHTYSAIPPISPPNFHNRSHSAAPKSRIAALKTTIRGVTTVMVRPGLSFILPDQNSTAIITGKWSLGVRAR